MSTLFREQCVACRRDSPRVTEAEIAELRRDVSAWQLLERDGIARLERVFHFPNFANAAGLMIRIEPSAIRKGRSGVGGSVVMRTVPSSGVATSLMRV